MLILGTLGNDSFASQNAHRREHAQQVVERVRRLSVDNPAAQPDSSDGRVSRNERAKNELAQAGPEHQDWHRRRGVFHRHAPGDSERYKLLRQASPTPNKLRSQAPGSRSAGPRLFNNLPPPKESRLLDSQEVGSVPVHCGSSLPQQLDPQTESWSSSRLSQVSTDSTHPSRRDSIEHVEVDMDILRLEKMLRQRSSMVSPAPFHTGSGAICKREGEICSTTVVGLNRADPSCGH